MAEPNYPIIIAQQTSRIAVCEKLQSLGDTMMYDAVTGEAMPPGTKLFQICMPEQMAVGGKIAESIATVNGLLAGHFCSEKTIFDTWDCGGATDQPRYMGVAGLPECCVRVERKKFVDAGGDESKFKVSLSRHSDQKFNKFCLPPIYSQLFTELWARVGKGVDEELQAARHELAEAQAKLAGQTSAEEQRQQRRESRIAAEAAETDEQREARLQREAEAQAEAGRRAEADIEREAESGAAELLRQQQLEIAARPNAEELAAREKRASKGKSKAAAAPAAVTAEAVAEAEAASSARRATSRVATEADLHAAEPPRRRGRSAGEPSPQAPADEAPAAETPADETPVVEAAPATEATEGAPVATATEMSVDDDISPEVIQRLVDRSKDVSSLYLVRKNAEPALAIHTYIELTRKGSSAEAIYGYVQRLDDTFCYAEPVDNAGTRGFGGPYLKVRRNRVIKILEAAFFDFEEQPAEEGEEAAGEEAAGEEGEEGEEGEDAAAAAAAAAEDDEQEEEEDDDDLDMDAELALANGGGGGSTEAAVEDEGEEEEDDDLDMDAELAKANGEGSSSGSSRPNLLLTGVKRAPGKAKSEAARQKKEKSAQKNRDATRERMVKFENELDDMRKELISQANWNLLPGVTTLKKGSQSRVALGGIAEKHVKTIRERVVATVKGQKAEIAALKSIIKQLKGDPRMSSSALETFLSGYQSYKPMQPYV